MNLFDSLKNLFTQHDGWLWESHLVTRLGTNRDELRTLREKLLTEGVDWRFQKNRVEISPEGVKKLAAHFKLDEDAPAGVQTIGATEATPGLPDEKTAPASSPQEGVEAITLLVWRIFPKNKHIIEAYPEGANPQDRQNVMRVKVRDSSRFTRFDNTGKPLALQCRHLQADYYEHIGGQPKRRGRF